MSTTELRSRLEEYDSICSPMIREKRFRELGDRIIEMLETEYDPDLRFAFIVDLTTFLHLAGDEERSLRWAENLTVEFPDNPIAWTRIAKCYSPLLHPGSPTDANTIKAFESYQMALEVARQKDEFVRYVLFDICRFLRDVRDYERLIEYMNEILADMETQRTYDIPQFEADWLRQLPTNAIDPELRRTFIRLEAADQLRRQTKKFSTKPPTFSDLEQDEGE